MIWKDNAYQKLDAASYSPPASNGAFNFMSAVINSPIQLYSHNSVDSCWESGDVYVAKYSLGKVTKYKFNGNVISTLSLTSPSSVSVIQNSCQMVTEKNIKDKGCWIIDGNSVIKTDNNLNVLTTISGFSSPIFVVSAKSDEGCFVIDNGLGISRLQFQ